MNVISWSGRASLFTFPGKAILGLLHRAASAAEANYQQTLEMTHKLSAELRAAEDPSERKSSDQWASGCRNGAELWRRLTARGFRGSLRVVGEWATRRRRAEKADAKNLQRIPSARTIARLMTIGMDTLSKAETVTVAAIEDGIPALVEAREIIAAFHMMIRRKAVAALRPWIERAGTSLAAAAAAPARASSRRSLAATTR